MGKRSIAYQSRRRSSRSFEIPRVVDETNNHDWEPRQIRSFSPKSSKSPRSPLRSSPVRAFRLPKSLLARSRSKSVSSDPQTPRKEAPKEVPPNPISPAKRKRKFPVHFLRRPVFFARNVSKGSKGSTGTATDISEEYTSSLGNTRVFAVSSPKSKSKAAQPIPETIHEPEEGSQPSKTFSCATAILSLECCGADHSFEADDEHVIQNRMPEDPTVQQSLECIFASQLQEGLNLWDDDEEVESISLKNRSSELQSPALVQQSRLNRSNRRLSTELKKSGSIRRQRSLQYLGEYDPDAKGERSLADNSIECPCDRSSLPPLNPESWPQAPLLLRPTRNSGTRIKGVRFASEKEHFWNPESEKSWTDPLASRWGKLCHETPTHRCCEKCAILPINNGNEKSGESLVIDFETDDFEGTFLLRLRFSEGTTPEPYDDNIGYFEGLNRRYQAIVRGRFKKQIPLTELSTGFRFERPCGKLPPKWILRGAIKVLKFFAPQLDARLDGQHPHSLSPLGSTPQSILVETEESDYLDDIREEPTEGRNTLLGEASGAESTMQRAKFRKRNFDKLFVHGSKEEMTDTSKIYTFEFLQHLFDFEEFSIELGSMVGSIKLEEVLDGQPLQFMATHGDKKLWSFDIWHKCLWQSAVAQD
ncbi:unnamed protein product [Cylindrotheca closterium]|uniref:Domain of unknown function at the cortex 1 domain-containing protein n=1 Tax=Cylindrotheca closterium TaxID=2856 RepID=A0AAD2CFX9_9STRA|nr:unnamed protein product [Cylindrotheca closterium]